VWDASDEEHDAMSLPRASMYSRVDFSWCEPGRGPPAVGPSGPRLSKSSGQRMSAAVAQFDHAQDLEVNLNTSGILTTRM